MDSAFVGREREVALLRAAREASRSGRPALVLLGGEAGAADRNPLLVNPVSRYVGRLSYSLYLWHWPVLVLGVAVLPEELHVAVPLVLSFVLATL